MSYYNLDQTLKVFQEYLPNTLLPFALPQLADLCRQGALTPVFGYDFYISKPCHYEDDGRPLYAPCDSYEFKGYLTHDHLIGLIDGYIDSLSISMANNLEGEKDIILFDRYQKNPELAEPSQFTVTQKNIRIAVNEVKNHIASEQNAEQNTHEQPLIAKLKNQIADLESQLSQAKTKLTEIPTSHQKTEKQGDSLLILGAVMHCIKDVAKKNYTQDLLTQTILDRYKNVNGISKSTLDKKYSEAKKYLKQRYTP